MSYFEIGVPVLVLLLIIGLFMFVPKMEEIKHPAWKLLFLLPGLIAIIYHFEIRIAPCFVGLYAASVIMALGFFLETVKARRGFCVAAGMAMLGTIAMLCLQIGLPCTPYAKEFRECFATMKTYYCLTDEKQIDWDRLYETYAPRFQKAEQEKDAVQNYIAWYEFTSEFHDAHTYYTTDTKTEEKAYNLMFGNDYGVSLMNLADGSVVAVNVEAGLGELTNGTRILSWDGKSIDEVQQGITYSVMAFPDKENEAFYDALLVAGVGGDSVTITYEAADGSEKEMTLKKRGPYYEGRLKKTLEIIDQGVDIAHLGWKECGNNTVLLRIKAMMYDTESYESRNHEAMKTQLRKQLIQYREQGHQNLIIDLRNNSGGSPDMIAAIMELLAPKGEHILAYDGVLDEKDGTFVRDEDGYMRGEAFTYRGEDLWQDRHIYILVNQECVSAGDWFTQEMDKYDNVTILGFTKSNGSGQGIHMLRTDEAALSFSAVVALDEDGRQKIDAGVDRIARTSIDETIAFDDKAVDALFNRGEDYVLEYCLDYIEKKQSPN